MLKIYSPNETVYFYRAHGLRPPADLMDFDTLSVDLATTQTSKARPVFQRFLSRRDIAMIYGAPNIGKSPFADSIMYALARGCDLTPMHTISAPMSVLMVCGEMRDDQLKKRQAWYEKMFPSQKADTFFEVSRFTEDLAEPKGQQLLERLIMHLNAKHRGQQNIALVILDSIKTLARSGDGQQGWNNLFGYLDQTRHDHDRTWILIHHTNKGQKQSFGSFDIDIKLDVKVHLSEEIPNLEKQIARPGISANQLKNYADFLSQMHCRKFSEDRADAIRFYLTIEKGRDLKKTDRRTILLSFVPEDAYPKWDVEDIFSPESAWSFDAWQGQTSAATDQPFPDSQKLADSRSTPEISSPQTLSDCGGTMPSQGALPDYDQLKLMPKDEVIKYLKLSVASQHSSRSAIGTFFGISQRKAKDAIDYLMKKNKLKNEDIGLSKS